MIDYRDLMDDAINDVREAWEIAMGDLTKPRIKNGLKMAWANLPPEKKDKLVNEQPEEYADLMQEINKGE